VPENFRKKTSCISHIRNYSLFQLVYRYLSLDMTIENSFVCCYKNTLKDIYIPWYSDFLTISVQYTLKYSFLENTYIL
jgi:hypothetical protein